MPLTFEATMYFPYNTTSDYTHIIMSNFERTQTGFVFEITKGGQPTIMFYDEDDVRTRYTFSNVSVYNGKKTHIAIAADVENSKIHCYVDGEIAQSLDLTINPLDFSASMMAFGTDHREVNLNLFRGALINVACYSDVRTADEIKAESKFVAQKILNGIDNLEQFFLYGFCLTFGYVFKVVHMWFSPRIDFPKPTTWLLPNHSIILENESVSSKKFL